MSVRGNTSGEYFGEWFGPVEVVPGAMSANIGGSGTVGGTLTPVVSREANSGGYIRVSDRRRTQKEIDEARRKFGIVVPEEEAAEIVAEAIAEVKTLSLPKKQTKRESVDDDEIRKKLIAWLEADLAAQQLTARVRQRDFMIAVMVSALIAA